MKRPTHVLSALALLVLAPGARADSLNGLRSSVARVGDVNGDGVPDLAVASRDRDRPERVWILSGKDGARLLEVSGSATGDRFGSQLVEVGDWDRDGAADLLVVARPRRFQDAPGSLGYRRVVSGRSGRTLAEFPGSDPVGGTRDLDGDGHVDLLLVLESMDTHRTAIVVRSSRDNSDILRVRGHTPIARADALMVEALAWMDDIDGDGRPDFAAARSRGLQGAQLDGVHVSYEVMAISGDTGRALWRTPPDAQSTERAALLTLIGDTNADGVGELVGAVEDGWLRLFDGKSGSIRWTRILPRHVLYSLGSSLDRAGDVDRDGVEDCILSANESFFFDAGLCQLVSGKTGEILRALPEDENFGFDACGLGDVNGDGVPDFAVGAERQRGWTPDDSSEPAVQVRSGKDASILWMRRHVDLRK